MTNSKLPRYKPEEQGVSSSGILEFLKAVKKDSEGTRSQELHSFMFLRHGHVIAEGWWSPYEPDYPHMLFSLSKSFTSSAIGIAIDEGLISLEDFVVSFFPEYISEKTNVYLSSIRIKHLLSMSTGNAEDTMGYLFNQEDWVKAFFSVPVIYEPGTHFLYNTGATYMLSAIIQRVTGQKLIDYLQPRLFEPLGIENPAWETCPRGVNTGGFGLKIKTEDIAKFGQLYLRKGVWNNRRILSEKWIIEASAIQISNGDDMNSDWSQGYGYQFWKCRHGAYRGDGAFGQYCIILPEQDCVIAMTGGLADMQIPLNHIWDHLLPAIKNEPLTPDSKMQAELERTLKTLMYAPEISNFTSKTAENLSGKIYSFEKNILQIQDIMFEFNNNYCKIVLHSDGGLQTINCGYCNWINGSYILNGNMESSSASGIWTEDNKFLLTLRNIETPFVDTVLFAFNDSRLILNVSRNVSFDQNKSFELTGILNNSNQGL